MLGRLIIAVSLIAAVATPAGAQTADELAAKAAKKVDEKKYAEAAELYAKAARLEPSVAKHVCNTGMAYYAASNYPWAFHYLTLCSEMDESRRKANNDIMKFLIGQATPENKLAHFTIDPRVDNRTRDDATVYCDYFAGHGLQRGGGNYLLPYGTYKFRIEAPGYETVELDYEAKSASQLIKPVRLVKVEAQPEPAKTPAKIEPQVPVERQPEPVADTGPAVTAQTDSPSFLSRAAPWMAFGGAAVGVVVGVWAHGEARDERNSRFECDDNGDNCHNDLTGNDLDEARSAIRNWEILEFSMFGAAAGAAALGTYLLLRDDNPKESQLSVSTTPGADGAMVWFSVKR